MLYDKLKKVLEEQGKTPVEIIVRLAFLRAMEDLESK